MNDMSAKITYKRNIPYYKGMPCFVNGMRLNSHPRVDKEGFLSAYYWRDGGLWGCKVSEIYPNVFAYNDEYLSHLYLNATTPMTLEEWKNDNGHYCHNASNVIEALTKSGYGGHEGIDIE
jgi:hypothetical protein